MDDPEILRVLRQRFSPREFDVEHELGAAELASLLEAARWAPSAGNSQPWVFYPAVRGTQNWSAVVECLAGSSRPWAVQASALIVNIAHTQVEGTDWEFSEFSVYDLGQAVAHMTIQAHSMGLGCRQFRAFDKNMLTDLLGIPDHLEILTMTAIGRSVAGGRHADAAAQRNADIIWPRR